VPLFRFLHISNPSAPLPASIIIRHMTPKSGELIPKIWSEGFPDLWKKNLVSDPRSWIFLLLRDCHVVPKNVSQKSPPTLQHVSIVLNRSRVTPPVDVCATYERPHGSSESSWKTMEAYWRPIEVTGTASLGPQGMLGKRAWNGCFVSTPKNMISAGPFSYSKLTVSSRSEPWPTDLWCWSFFPLYFPIEKMPKNDIFFETNSRGPPLLDFLRLRD